MKLSDCWVTLVHEAVGENGKRLHHMFSKRGFLLFFFFFFQFLINYPMLCLIVTS